MLDLDPEKFGAHGDTDAERDLLPLILHANEHYVGTWKNSNLVTIDPQNHSRDVRILLLGPDDNEASLASISGNKYE